MNPLALIPLASALAIGVVAAFLLANQARDRAARTYVVFCAVAGAVCFAEFHLQAFGTVRDAADLWIRLRGLWPMGQALLLQVLLQETGAWGRHRAWLAPLLYLPSIAAVILDSCTRLVLTGLALTRFGWAPVRSYSPVFYLVIGWGAVLGTATLVLALRGWLAVRDPARRRRGRFMALALVGPALLGIVADGALALAGIDLPRFATLGALIAAVLAAAAVRRTRFFVVSPASAAEAIVAGMSDLLLLTDAHGRILRTNRAALNMLGLHEEEITGRGVEEVVPQLATVRSRPSSVKEIEAEMLTRDQRNLVLSVSTSRIRHPDGRVMGMSLIARDISDRQRLQQAREALVRGMIQAQDEERRRIARELHDETGQVLGSLIAELRVLEDQVNGEEVQRRVSDMRHLVTMALQEIQRISRGMHPGVLDTLGLAAALQHFASEFSRLHEIKVTTELLGLEDPLPPELKTTVYRVVQEAMTNVVRHAEAKVVSLFVIRQGELLRAIVEDDGRGFDAEPTAPVRGLGLLGIEERVKLLGGTVRLETAPGEGVTLKVELPVPGPSPATFGPERPRT